MRLVFGNYNFIRPAGTETYFLTTGERLSRLGHEVCIFSMALGPLADEARRRGMKVTDNVRELPDECDLVVAQDGPTAYALAERYPTTPQVFQASSDVFDLARPPRLPELTKAIVALSERTAGHLRAFALDAEITRLRLPVDLDRFAPAAPIAPRPRRVLLLGNYLRGRRREILLEAWDGLEFEIVGRHGERFRTDVATAMNEVDIVVGRALVVVEAMACGRAAYVYDGFGTDGWVTPESYPALEADNFHGMATDGVPDPDRLREALAEYHPDMGLVNRDLAEHHHSAEYHVRALVELFERHAGAGAAAVGPLEEMAWLARQNWLTESRAFDAGLDANRAHEEAARLREERDGLARELEDARAAAAAAHDALERERAAMGREQANLAEVAQEVDRQRVANDEFRASRRFQVAVLLAAPLERLRRLLRR